MISVQHQIKLWWMSEMAMKIKQAKQNFFEKANKPGKWLAYRLRKEQTRNQIINLEGQEGDTKWEQKEIKKLLRISIKRFTLGS